MRVYEIAKEAGISSTDVLNAAEKSGVEVSNAISTVEAADVEKIRQALAGHAAGEVEAKRSAKRSKAAEQAATRRTADQQSLARHLAIAKDAAAGKKVETKTQTPAPAQPAVAAKSVAESAAKPALRTTAPTPIAKPKPAIPAKRRIPYRQSMHIQCTVQRTTVPE